MGGLLEGLLFSRPAHRTGWGLEEAATELTSAWLTQQDAPLVTQRSPDFPTPGMFAPLSSPRMSAQEFVQAPDGGPPTGPGFWIANASGNWSTGANWKDGIVASGATAPAHFDTLNITTDVTVTLDNTRGIGELHVGDTNGTHRYTIKPGSGTQRLIFDSLGATSVLHQTSTSAGDTISVPIFLNNDLAISNASTTNPFQISGNIASNLSSGELNLSFSGTVNVSGDITPGTNGGDLRLSIGGNVNLSGTNTYGGSTFVTGTLFVKGDNSGADGFVQVSGTSSLLSGTGTVGGIVTIFGGSITGGSTTTVGQLTLTQNLNINAGEGGGGTYLANLDGATSDLLSITGTLNIGNGTTLNIQGIADGTTTYTLATYLSHTGMFDNVLGLPQGYSLVYLPNELDLVPIPEPATWVGGALAMGAIAVAVRRRRIRNADRGSRN
jgi:hypothetical protein